MKIRINTPVARIEADLPEQQVAAILKIALDYATGGTGAEQTPIIVAPPDPAPKTYSRQEKPAQNSAEDGYKGFLYIKCEECGATKGFCAKVPIQEYRCDCGHVTELKDLKPLFINCKCGDSFKYRTNHTEATITMNCIHCDSPVDLEYHEKKGVYTTIE